MLVTQADLFTGWVVMEGVAGVNTKLEMVKTPRPQQLSPLTTRNEKTCPAVTAIADMLPDPPPVIVVCAPLIV